MVLYLKKVELRHSDRVLRLRRDIQSQPLECLTDDEETYDWIRIVMAILYRSDHSSETSCVVLSIQPLGALLYGSIPIIVRAAGGIPPLGHTTLDALVILFSAVVSSAFCY